jgi:hypothetical protein
MKARREGALVWKKLARIDRSPAILTGYRRTLFTGRETKEIVIKMTGAAFFGSRRCDEAFKCSA